MAGHLSLRSGSPAHERPVFPDQAARPHASQPHHGGADVPVFVRSTARPMTGTSPTSIRWRCRGPAMFCIEATAVEAIGRITPGCLGLWNDATEAALKPILASVRKHSKTAVMMQLAHAGRKASSHTPWDGGQLIPVAEGGWRPEGASAIPHKEGETPPLALDAAGLDARARRLRGGGQARRAARHRRHRGALRARLSAASVPVADRQPAHRPIWRLACRTACAFRSKCSTRCARRFRHDKPVGIRVSCDRLGRGRLGSAADHRIRARS